MITEDYVSFETAKFLKEKGFRCNTLHYYYDKDGHLFFSSWTVDVCYNEFVAPTLQMAMKYLRKIHNLHCVIDYDIKLGWYSRITSLKETVEDHYTEMKTYLPQLCNCSSCEQVTDATIQYCLKELI